MKISRLSFALALIFLGSSCSSSEFASNASTNKKNRPNSGDGDPNDPNDPNNPNNTDQENGEGTGNPDDVDSGTTMNPDGTLTERFKGSLTRLEGGSDIIFAVDTSGSMRTEKTMLEQHMTTFLNKFSQENAKLDYQVFLIGEGFNFPQNLGEKFIPVQRKVSSNDALAVLRDFFSGTIPQPKPVRPDTKKQIVVVTDDDAEKVTAPIFRDFVNATPSLKDKTSMNGFVILPNSALNNWCTKAAVGNAYITLGADAATKGTIYDLCTPDWSVLLKGLAEKILQESPKERFALNAKPENPDDIVVTVGGSEADDADWSYDADTNTIVFTKESAPGDGVKVTATFTPASE